MKILLTGGGTGGHFYPIIAVAEELNRLIADGGFVGVELYYVSDSPYDKDALMRNNLRFIEIQTGKIRTYASPKNILDKFKTFFAILKAVWRLFLLYPDVVFGKGGYASFPAICAARILRIPVVIHESDAIPGRVNRWVASYAQNIAIAFPESAKYFSQSERVALVGNPIRKALQEISRDGAKEFFGLDQNIPTILVMGGSQGSEKINEAIMDILLKLVERFQIIHQSGNDHYQWMKKRSEGILTDHPHISRYKLYPFLDQDTIQKAAGAADLIIARSGSSLFEFALWGIPSILIPLPIAREDHQRENAYSYARTGGAVVLEEENLKPELLFHMVTNVFENTDSYQKMKIGTQLFAHRDAGEKIARLLLSIGQSHE